MGLTQCLIFWMHVDVQSHAPVQKPIIIAQVLSQCTTWSRLQQYDVHYRFIVPVSTTTQPMWFLMVDRQPFKKQMALQPSFIPSCTILTTQNTNTKNKKKSIPSCQGTHHMQHAALRNSQSFHHVKGFGTCTSSCNATLSHGILSKFSPHASCHTAQLHLHATQAGRAELQHCSFV